VRRGGSSSSSTGARRRGCSSMEQGLPHCTALPAKAHGCADQRCRRAAGEQVQRGAHRERWHSWRRAPWAHLWRRRRAHRRSWRRSRRQRRRQRAHRRSWGRSRRQRRSKRLRLRRQLRPPLRRLCPHLSLQRCSLALGHSCSDQLLGDCVGSLLLLSPPLGAGAQGPRRVTHGCGEGS
jgi:hypothetical protein